MLPSAIRTSDTHDSHLGPAVCRPRPTASLDAVFASICERAPRVSLSIWRECRGMYAPVWKHHQPRADDSNGLDVAAASYPSVRVGEQRQRSRRVMDEHRGRRKCFSSNVTCLGPPTTDRGTAPRQGRLPDFEIAHAHAHAQRAPRRVGHLLRVHVASERCVVEAGEPTPHIVPGAQCDSGALLGVGCPFHTSKKDGKVSQSLMTYPSKPHSLRRMSSASTRVRCQHPVEGRDGGHDRAERLR